MSEHEVGAQGAVDERPGPGDTPSGGTARPAVRDEPLLVPHRSPTDRTEHLVVTGADAKRVSDIGLDVARMLGRPFVDGDGLVDYHRREQHDPDGEALDVLERVLSRRDTVVVSMSTVLLDLVDHVRTWSVLVDTAHHSSTATSQCSFTVDDVDARRAAEHTVDAWRRHVAQRAG